MQENNTTPEQEGQGQNPQDLLNASLIFARALGLMLNDGEGIVVDIVGEMNLGEGINKVIVFEHNDQVHIYKCDEDIPEGSAVNMNSTTPPETENGEETTPKTITED
jgi:hypothetical protein